MEDDENFDPESLTCPYCKCSAPMEYVEVDPTGLWAKCPKCGCLIEGDF